MKLHNPFSHSEGPVDPKPLFGAGDHPQQGSPEQRARVQSLEATRLERELGGDSLAAAGVMRQGVANVANDMASEMLETGSHPVVPERAFDDQEQMQRAKIATGQHEVVNPAVLAQAQNQIPPDHQLHA